MMRWPQASTRRPGWPRSADGTLAEVPRKVMSNITVIYLFFGAAQPLHRTSRAINTVPPRLGFEDISERCRIRGPFPLSGDALRSEPRQTQFQYEKPEEPGVSHGIERRCVRVVHSRGDEESKEASDTHHGHRQIGGNRRSRSRSLAHRAPPFGQDEDDDRWAVGFRVVAKARKIVVL